MRVQLVLVVGGTTLVKEPPLTEREGRMPGTSASESLLLISEISPTSFQGERRTGEFLKITCYAKTPVQRRGAGASNESAWS